MAYEDPVHQEAQGRPLDFLWLELTRTCNLACMHCYEESSPRLPLMGSMTTDDWVSVIHEAAQMGVETIDFIGGEPTLHPDLPLLIKTASDLGITVGIYTNGTAIKKPLWDVLVRHDVKLAFSYYSVDAVQHNAVTTRPGSHTKTLAAIQRALDLGLDVRIGVIHVPGINDDTLEATVEQMRNMGAVRVSVDRMRGIGRGQRAPAQNPRSELCGACGDKRMAIDSDGNVAPCVMSKFSRLGHVRDGLNKIITGEAIQQFQERMAPAMACTNCNPDDKCMYCHPARCDPSGGCSP